MSKTCLFCGSPGPFSAEHIVPESLGNDDLILNEEVCSACNRHFSKIEEFVLQNTIIAFWRVFLGIRSKRGSLPSANLSQPKRDKGRFRSRHPRHTDLVSFSAHEDGSTSADIDDPEILRRMLNNECGRFEFVMTPKVLFNLGRFLCKMGIESICSNHSSIARHSMFDTARKFARSGSPTELWPIFHYSEGNLKDFRRVRPDVGGYIEEVECYSHAIINYGDEFCLFRFGMGTDNWIVCLNDPYPTPEISAAFPNARIQCIWYSSDEIR